MDLNAVVRHYKQRFRKRADEELGSFRAERTLDDAIRRAGLAEEPDVIEGAAAKLATCSVDIAAVSNFARLFEVVRSAVNGLDGIGELYVYDTALRIGAKKGTLPIRIYLHAGTRRGAKALGIEVESVKGLYKFELPSELEELEAHEIEDVLCIYKRYFTGERPELDDNDVCWIDEVDEEEP